MTDRRDDDYSLALDPITMSMRFGVGVELGAAEMTREDAAHLVRLDHDGDLAEDA